MFSRSLLSRLAAEVPTTSTNDLARLSQRFPTLALSSPRLQLLNPRRALSACIARRSISAAAQKTPVKKAPAAKKTTTTKKPAAKKTTKAKTTTKAAAKKKTTTKKAAPKKKAAAKKPAPKKKKVLTERQKALAERKQARDDLKALKEAALEEPKNQPSTAYQIFLGDAIKKSGGGQKLGDVAKVATQDYKNISPAERESLNHTAASAKAANIAAYEKWVLSFTPEQIRLANNARRRLRTKLPKTKSGEKRSGRGLSPIRDPRQVKRPQNAYLMFVQERYQTDDFKGIAFADAAKLLREEFGKLGAADLKKYEDAVAQQLQDYAKNYKSTYGHDPPSKK
ncbi:hypothetical protein K402DRAFT_390824 [Aulographum hederae CBS 113979]|uniref:HMG box domain-containing protein n=1 Tax=Aulographum hederae CBS 113979 TaxID=1176131 RepID=A0A6G1H857_9PEZI|nr:hypothetical protein K402DRAFT_390824 [Aulographum hederae CBS 113979]